MSTPEIIDTPAACIKCGFITDSPTTGKTQNKCPCCGGLLISVNKLTPGENVIVLAKRASWECSNDDGEWYGRRTTEEQIIKHFAPLGAELATLRAQLAAKEQDAKRMAGDNLEILDKLEELAVSYGKLQDAHAALQEQHKRAVELLREARNFLRELIDGDGGDYADWVIEKQSDIDARIAAVFDAARKETTK